VVAVQLPGSYEGAVAQAAVGLSGAVLLPVVMIYGPREPGLDPDDRAVLMYTSGTTADPKGVQHSHRTLLAEATSLVYTHSGPRARQLGLFPPGHIAGLLSLLRILLLGTPTVIMQAWDAALAASLIDRHAVTSAGGAPVQLSSLLDQQVRGTAALATLREFLTGAAPVPPSLIRRADAAGITAYRSYGSSEHPTVTAGTIADSLDRRAATDGRVVAGNQVRITGPDGRDVPPGHDGEIFTRGPELFTGYTDAALNAAAFAPGRWFRTGDVGRLDGDGYLTVTDRLKDIIIRGGENISSKEVEDLLITHPAVADVAVIPSPDPVMGERVCAVVVLRPGFSFGIDEARAHFAAAGAARQKTPEIIAVTDELPRTPSGKVRKDVLRAARSRRSI
jgi:cyclohexanecarboxylate-CoA ligase